MVTISKVSPDSAFHISFLVIGFLTSNFSVFVQFQGPTVCNCYKLNTSDKPTIHYPPYTKQQRVKVSD